MEYTLPGLHYAYEALEPYFDSETMIIHHTRHHKTYVDNLNKAIDKTTYQENELEDILREISKYGPFIRNNAGGHYNHDLFWKTLSPNAKLIPEKKLSTEINKVFGSLDILKQEIKKLGLGQFGSGWVWLFVKYNGELTISATANQDNPLMDTNFGNQGYPILGVDVWEHAYYLKYKNARADYLDAFWSVLDWSVVEKNYTKALSKLL